MLIALGGNSVGTFKHSYVAAALACLSASSAWCFDFSRYQPTNLDHLLAQQRPQSGVDLYPARPLKLDVLLAEYGHPCDPGVLKRSMIATGIPTAFVEAVPLSRCIKVRSAKGALASVFIQDKVAEFLPGEVPLGSALTLYAIHVFTGPDGPGLLANEFLSDRTPLPKPDEGQKNGGLICPGETCPGKAVPITG